MKEPTTDAEFEAAIEAAGYEFDELEEKVFAVRCIAGGGVTVLHADGRSDALFEAWHLVKE